MTQGDQGFEASNVLEVGVLLGYLYGELEAELSRRSKSVRGDKGEILKSGLPDHPLAPEALAYLCRSVGRYLEGASDVEGITKDQQPHAARRLQDWGERLVPPEDPMAEGELGADRLFELISDLQVYLNALGLVSSRVRKIQQDGQVE